MCNCITKVQDLIREKYDDPEASINVGFSFLNSMLDVKPSGVAFTYRPKKKDGTYSDRKKEVGLSLSYCPFCGVEYSAKEEPTP
jgi:hypothetical protein